MSDLGITSDGTPTDSFSTIPDVPIDAISNRITPNQVASGVTRGIQQLGSDKVYSDGGNNQVIVADTVPRVLMGNQKTFGEGFYVSKSGVDATKNTDPAQWIFNSNQNVFKIVQSSSISNTIPASPAMAASSTRTSTVVHNLGVVPGFLAYVTTPSGFPSNLVQTGVVALPTIMSIQDASGLGAITLWISARADTTNLYFDISNLTTATITGPYVFTFKYYILQETAT